MRLLIRMTLALATLGALCALTAGAVAAGNYAETSIVDGADTPPTAGEQRELHLLLLQHGVTPVDHGTVELTAWLPGTDERISVMATSTRGGEWVANVTFPTAGDWRMRILHSVFDTPEASVFAVAPSSMATWLPATGSIALVLLVAVGLIVGARRVSGARASNEPVGEALRSG
jgi:YtkA-like